MILPSKLKEPPTASKQAIRVSLGTLLISERRTTKAVRATVKDASDRLVGETVNHHRLRDTAAIMLILSASKRLATEIETTLHTFKSQSWAAGARRFEVELRAALQPTPGVKIGRRTRDVKGYSAAKDLQAATTAESVALVWRQRAIYAVQKALREDAEAASALRGLAVAMEPSVTRAAATESAQAYDLGHVDGASDLGEFPDVVILDRWDAMLDACPKCRALDGDLTMVGQPFESGEEPAFVHPRCLPGDSLVLSGSCVKVTTERRFEGSLVILRTASGKHLRCTPNHPILTDSGFIAAGLLKKGEYVISDVRLDWESSAGKNVNNVPSRIEEIAKSFGIADNVTPVSVPVSAKDFHGDGMAGQIAVVRTDRLLRNDGDTPLTKQRVELRLVRAGGSRLRLSSDGSGDEQLEWVDGPSDGIVSGPDLPLSLGGSHLGPREQLGLGTAPGGEAGLLEQEVDRRPLDPKPLAGGQNGLTVTVAPDEIAHVDVVAFDGQVYNLETSEGFYLAQGIVTHNCRCTRTTITLPRN